MTNRERDHLLARLHDARPYRAFQPDPSTLSELVRGAAEQGRVSLRRKVTLGAGAIAVALVLGVGSPAIASGLRYLAETGWFGSSPNPAAGSPDASSEADGGEWIDSSRSDFVEYAERQWPSYVTLPPAYEASKARYEWAVDLRDAANGALMQRSNIVRQFETGARCLWIDAWVKDDAAGDSSSRAAAAAQLAAAANWPATVSTSDQATQDSYEAIAAAATDGDRSALEAELSAGCSTFVDVAGR